MREHLLEVGQVYFAFGKSAVEKKRDFEARRAAGNKFMIIMRMF